MHGKLIIGCGGSGLATMTEFCKRLAYSRNRNSQEYRFLAIDSDKSALSDFVTRIHLLGDGHFARYVHTFLLDRDIGDIVQESLIDPFKNGENLDGQKRLQRHWWHDANGQPYRGSLTQHRAVDLYGVTWDRLSNIELVIRNVIESMVRNEVDDGDVLLSVEVYVISSLAGETGRGSWNLVAHKVREYLRDRFNIYVRPLGVFYDAMVYNDLFKRIVKDFELRCKVNALTGLSELSCWLRRERGANQSSYRLPHLKTPQRELCDVLVSGGVDGIPCDGPIRDLRLIGENAYGCRTHLDYIRETADALFLEMSSRALESRRINNYAAVGSFGSATFEVEAAKIEGFCTAAAYNIVLNRMLDSGEDVAPDVAQFFDVIPINKKVNGIADVRPDGDGNIFQRLACALVKRNRARFEHFLQSLPSMNTNEAKKEMEYVVRRMSAVDAESALGDVLSALGIEGGLDGINAVVEASALRVLRGSSGQNLSLGRVRNFLMRIDADISMSCDLPAKIDPPMVAEDAIKDFGKRTILEMVLCKPRFNECEIATLLRNEGDVFSGVVADQFLVENYAEIRYVVIDLLHRVQEEVRALISRVEKMERCCREIRGTFETDVYESVDIPINADAFKELFVLPDRSLDAIVDDERGGRRILKPIVESRESLSQLIGGALSVDSGLEDFCEQMLRQATSGDAAPSSSGLSQLIIDNVRLRDGFVEDNFSFVTVLSRNQKYWNVELDQRKEEAAWLDKASDLFRRTLGAEPSVDGNGSRRLPPVDELKKSIVATFMHRTKPCWDIEDPYAELGEMTVWMPFEMTENERRICAHHAEMDARETCPVVLLDITDSASSPYAYYSHVDVSVAQRDCADERQDIPSLQGKLKNEHDAQSAGGRAKRHWFLFDAIRSLRYYRDPDVLVKLEETEREDGKSIFDENPSRCGLGYPSPIYVRDARWSALRWKPWVPVQETSD